MQIIGRSVGAALATGNTCILKPAEEACLTALAFGALTKKAGFPDGVLNIVTGSGKTGASLSQHSDIDHISFTGSVSTGIKIQQSAAQNVIPVTLELGGKSPQIVFADADLDAALPFLVNAGVQNAGQTCSASSRILVQKEVYPKARRLVIRNGESPYGSNITISNADKYHRETYFVSVHTRNLAIPQVAVASSGQSISVGSGYNK